MPKVLLQAGHYPDQGGAPGEAAWTHDLAQRLAARLETVGVNAIVVGAWPLDNGAVPPEVHQDYDLFVSLHYDAAIYGEGHNTGCFVDRAAKDPCAMRSDAAASAWKDVYPAHTGIPLCEERRNANTWDYYAFRATTDRTPGILVEHGCGAPVPVPPYPVGEDAAYLHEHLDEVVEADALAIAQFLGSAYPAQPAAPQEDTVTDTEREVMQAQVDQLNGVNTTLQQELDAVRQQLADANSTIGALEHDVIPSLRAAAEQPALPPVAPGRRRAVSAVLRFDDGPDQEVTLTTTAG